MPDTRIDARFSSPDAAARSWADARETLERAELYWLTTVRRDGRPHTTPLIGLWIDDCAYFVTGSDEQKARNLEANPHCSVMTGCNTLHAGFDVIVEGRAEQVADESALRRLIDAYVAKYGEEWRFTLRDGALHNQEGGRALTFRIRPSKAIGFGKDPYTQTTWRF